MKRPAFSTPRALRAPRSSRWVPGNHFELLENGEEYFRMHCVCSFHENVEAGWLCLYISDLTGVACCLMRVLSAG